MVAGEKKAGKPKAKLKAFKDTSMIALDEATQLDGIPAEAWDYKLGNRSALEPIRTKGRPTRPDISSIPTIEPPPKTSR